MNRFTMPALFIYLLLLCPHHLLSKQSENSSIRYESPIYRKLYLHTDREYYFLGDSVWFKAYYLEGGSNTFIPGLFNMYAEFIDFEGRVMERKVYPLEDGSASGVLVLPDSIKVGEYLLRAYTDFQKLWGEDAFFQKYIQVSRVRTESEPEETHAGDRTPDIDLAFLPEGGILLAGQMNTVGIKALDESGRGFQLYGEILDSKGSVAATFHTRYKGMDTIRFAPREGETYWVNLPGLPGVRRQFCEVVSSGVKLELYGESEGNLLFRATSNSATFKGEHFHFAILYRGEVVYDKEFVLKDDAFPIKVNRDALSPGINRFILLDRKMRPISERLCFSKNYEINRIGIKSDKEAYETRSPVKIELINDEKMGEWALSNLSLAVVDRVSVGENGPEMNILSWLFLDSEIKGHIESPADYFTDDQEMESNEKLDLLMLTQGWSTYLWDTIPEPEAEAMNDEFEGITVSGSVRGAMSKKPVKRGEVTCYIFNRNGFVSYSTVTDNEGKFSFHDLYFTDSAGIFIQGFNNRGKPYTEVFMDSVFSEGPLVGAEYLPVPKSYRDFPVNLYQHQYFSEVELRDYLLKTGSIYLEGVTVIGDKQKYKGDGHFRIYGKPMDSFILTEKDHTFRNIADYLQGRVAGVMVVGNQIVMRGPGSFGGGGSPLFLLDGVPIDNQDVVMNIPMSDIELIEVLKNPAEAAIFGTRAANGVISVFTKRGGAGGSNTYTPGTIAKQIAGYASYRKFYSPVYSPENMDTEQPDHRITLFWEPEVYVTDGATSLSFFTSDDLSTYRILVEGVTQTGEVCLGYSELIVNE